MAYVPAAQVIDVAESVNGQASPAVHSVHAT